MAAWTLRCIACEWEHAEDQYYVYCPRCAGFLEVKLQAKRPPAVDQTFGSIFRFHEFLPIDLKDGFNPEHETIEPSPVVFAEKLSNYLDIELYYKDETGFPTGTWKDREGYISIYRLLRTGTPDLFVFSSGNTGTSLARSASIIKGPRLHLVLPAGSRNRIADLSKFYDSNYVKVYYFNGSNDECVEEARRLAKERNILTEGGFMNYARRECLKTLGLEIALEWDKHPDWYCQSVAGGIGIYGFYKAYVDTGKEAMCPKMLGVQADICSPMVDAWEAHAETLEEKYIPTNVISSPYVRVLRTRRPTDGYPILKKIMDKVSGAFEKVSGQEIHEALRFFYRDEYYRDIYSQKKQLVGLEAATALAGLVKAKRTERILPGARVLLNVSGAAKTGDVDLAWVSDLL